MAFTPEASRVPTTISHIAVTLQDSLTGGGGGAEPYQSAHFELKVLDQDERVMRVINGDLVPHLTPQQITGLLDFMSDLRAQAETQILP